MTTTELERALDAARAELARRTERCLAATSRALVAEARLAAAEDERDEYARRWAQAEAARQALAGEGPFAREVDGG